MVNNECKEVEIDLKTDEMEENMEIPCENIEEEDVRRSQRTRRLPRYLEDYEVEQFAMCSEAFLDSVPNSFEDAKSRTDFKNWKAAIEDEISCLNKNKTWTVIDKPKNVKLLESKWVFRTKRDELRNVIKHKARLVAKGFMQKEGFDYEETYAPVARLNTVRTLLAVANTKNLKIEQMDVKSAFLHGTSEEDIYMKVPEGFNYGEGKVLKLCKSLYGLKQGPYCWNKKFNEFALKTDFKRSNYDACLYVKQSCETCTYEYMLLYVDDIIIASNSNDEIFALKEALRKNFKMQDLGQIKLFLGINIKVTDDGLYLDQTHYIKNILRKFEMYNCKGQKTPMESGPIDMNSCADEDDFNKNTTILKLIGCLMYLMLCTRQDLSFVLNVCSRHQDKPRSKLWKTLKRVLRYLKETLNYSLFYRKSDCNEILTVYSDSDWAGDLQDRKSTSGYVFQIFGCTVDWCTKRQSTVALSSTKAEYVALTEAAKEGLWLNDLLSDFGFEKSIFTVYEDNQSCIKLVKRFEHKRLKHVDIKYNFIKDIVHKKLLNIEYVSTRDQYADILTKNLSFDLFSKHSNNLGLITHLIIVF